MKKEREEREGSRKMGCSTSVKLLLAIVCLPLSQTRRICVSTRTSRGRQKERKTKEEGRKARGAWWRSAEQKGKPSWDIDGSMYMYLMLAAIRNKLLEGPGN